MTGNKQI